MQKKTISYYAALIGSITLVAVCFMPWVHYNSINTTFSGFNVRRFASGVYYGRAGIIISIFAGLIFLLTLLQKNMSKRINLFATALLLAYTIRTYILFTGSLFDGEVKRLAGIYLIILIPIILLVCAIFPGEIEEK